MISIKKQVNHITKKRFSFFNDRCHFETNCLSVTCSTKGSVRKYCFIFFTINHKSEAQSCVIYFIESCYESGSDMNIWLRSVKGVAEVLLAALDVDVGVLFLHLTVWHGHALLEMTIWTSEKLGGGTRVFLRWAGHRGDLTGPSCFHWGAEMAVQGRAACYDQHENNSQYEELHHSLYCSGLSKTDPLSVCMSTVRTTSPSSLRSLQHLCGGFFLSEIQVLFLKTICTDRYRDGWAARCSADRDQASADLQELSELPRLWLSGAWHWDAPWCAPCDHERQP